MSTLVKTIDYSLTLKDRIGSTNALFGETFINPGIIPSDDGA